MNILFKQAYIFAEGSEHHHKTMDVLVESGVITAIKKNIATKTGVKLIEHPDLCLSLGWMDMQAVSGDPGFEQREDLDTLVKAAAAGGFTAVCLHNHNQPALHNKAQIEYILNKTKNKVVDVYPFGTITNKGEGNDLAEMYDMKLSGAMAFSNYKTPMTDTGSCLRAMQYIANIDSLMISHCMDQSLAHGGQMNEGQQAVMLGLKGIPALAEEIMVQRNIALVEYANAKLHIPTISTKGSVDLIKKAKASGLPITCGVAAINLLLDDSVLGEFDTNYKVDPPLRSKKDVQALRNALEIGVIDVVVSDHAPQDIESKELEFDLANNGIINLQTAFGCACEAMGDKNCDALIHALSVNPRKILNLAIPEVAEGAIANITAFTRNGSSNFSPKDNQSKSINSPFFQKSLKGKVIGVVNGSKSYFN
jgi:dihydroorotase